MERSEQGSVQPASLALPLVSTVTIYMVEVYHGVSQTTVCQQNLCTGTGEHGMCPREPRQVMYKSKQASWQWRETEAHNQHRKKGGTYYPSLASLGIMQTPCCLLPKPAFFLPHKEPKLQIFMWNFLIFFKILATNVFNCLAH